MKEPYRGFAYKAYAAFDIELQEVTQKIPIKCRIFLLQKLSKLQTTYQILVRSTTERIVQLMLRYSMNKIDEKNVRKG